MSSIMHSSIIIISLLPYCRINFFFFKWFLEFQYVLLTEIQKLTKIQNEILEQLRLLAMDNTVVTQNIDALDPVTSM